MSISLYILRRIIQMIPVTLLVMAIIFFVFRLIPGDPVQFLVGRDPDPETIAALTRKLGLDQPLIIQFLRWLGDAIRGDLGNSYINDLPVLRLVFEKFPATLELAVLAMLLGSAIGIPAGILAAIKQNSWLDFLVRVISLMGFSMPRYWLAILLVIVFSLNLGWIPPGGFVPLGESVADNLRFAILPTVTLALPIAAEQMRFLRSSMLEVIRQDYVRTAHAKGLAGRIVVMRHALKNALIPFLTIAGLQLGFLLGGSVVIEQITAWPGIGWLTLQSIIRRDYSVVQGVVLFSALAFLIINLLVDILYSVLDPRIEYS
ncbi:MAG: ABC transporter permease [Truepera sp.]|nr:ABC transporter permease [Truepera sp.]